MSDYRAERADVHVRRALPGEGRKVHCSISDHAVASAVGVLLAFFALREFLLILGQFALEVLRLRPVATILRRTDIAREFAVECGVLVRFVNTAIAWPLVADDGAPFVGCALPSAKNRI
ncbi:hypothetical protein G6F22_021846 [Rhizopus arrhizus]|nr:hypothetical protein G6F22_021846 [Rhizopus arrhizus]